MVISRDIVRDESKEWRWKQGSLSNKVLHENNIEDHASLILEEEPTKNEENTNINQAIRRSSRVRQQFFRLNDHEVFPDTAINEEGELLEEAMIAETEPIDFKQALSDPEWLAAMHDELEVIEKNKTLELVY